jgi:hypothetical protein
MTASSPEQAEGQRRVDVSACGFRGEKTSAANKRGRQEAEVETKKQRADGAVDEGKDHAVLIDN